MRWTSAIINFMRLPAHELSDRSHKRIRVRTSGRPSLPLLNDYIYFLIDL